MKLKNFTIFGLIMAIFTGCTSPTNKYDSFDSYPIRKSSLVEMEYTPAATQFSLWAPTAEDVRVMLYDTGHEGHASRALPMVKNKDEGSWHVTVEEDLIGKFYTFTVKVNDKWLGDTPGINARAVGVNGKRAAIIDMKSTDPEGWEQDKRPELNSHADAVIYELHHRDLSVHPSSGIQHKGKYLALTEKGTVGPGEKHSTGLDHIVELGINHVHLLPSFDHASIDETNLEENKYNWGYDPLNYNVPEGSYATDPYDPASRITEFKQMVQALHQVGIRVVMDVVYNHTSSFQNSNFELTVPGYFYRFNDDGSVANGSACGNETASERAMMRKYMIESVLYWINEYHVDGFRFDLMGIHDIETMNEIRKAVDKIDPSIIIYGEGWAAKAPVYPADSLAMKANTSKMPGIAAFSDEMRDGLRGPFNDDATGGFLAAVSGGEESIKFGLVGAINHPQINYDSVNYTPLAWAAQPSQMISYVSCHDDMCLVDRLKTTIPNLSHDELIRLNKLAQTVVFTSQGIPFIYAGEEILRDKKGVHNSYESPDAINAIDWEHKTTNHDLFDYYKGLIKLRENHPAFRMGNADLVRAKMEFLPVEYENLIVYRLKDNANGDKWNEIIIAFNSNKAPVKLTVPAARYTVVCRDGIINEKGLGFINGPSTHISAQSALIMYR